MSQCSRELIPLEPIQYVKLQVSSVNTSSIWNVLEEASPQQVGEMSSLLKSKLRESGSNAIFARGDRIIVNSLPSKALMDVKNVIPNANLISILSASMTILLENFQPKLITKPIGEILKEDALASSKIKGYESHSLLNILNSPSFRSIGTQSLDHGTLMTDLDKNGEVALYFVNSILGDTAKEAWLDALLAYGVENNYVVNPNQLKFSLHDLFQFVLTMIHDYRTLNAATEFDFILQDQKYLFGWWLNCPRTTDNCIFPELPKDLIFSVSPILRLYFSPGFELSMIVSATKPHVKSLKDVIEVDEKIWHEVYSILNSFTQGTTPKLETPSINEPEDTQVMIDLIHRVWPILLFVFWVVSSHVWVYWMFYCCWLVATRVVKRTHIPRPKVAN